MLLKENPYSFLTGDEPFVPVNFQPGPDGKVATSIKFDLKHEGFVGIPHGGIGMGLCLDAWHNLGKPFYPVTINFRFGGSGIFIGDEAILEVGKPESSAGSLEISITKSGDKKPYLRAEIIHADIDQPKVPTAFLNYNEFRALPYYRNCFVCGRHRQEPGLQRRFRVHQSDSLTQVTATWGNEADDFDRAMFFLIGKEELHPAALISIFDENTAWAGFMMTRSAGLSVRLEFTLLRPVGRTEKLMFVGEPTGIRGNPASPRFFTACGTIFALNGSNFEPVAYGKGEWIIMSQYTDQIKKNLIPDNDWEWIFT